MFAIAQGECIAGLDANKWCQVREETDQSVKVLIFKYLKPDLTIHVSKQSTKESRRG